MYAGFYCDPGVYICILLIPINLCIYLALLMIHFHSYMLNIYPCMWGAFIPHAPVYICSFILLYVNYSYIFLFCPIHIHAPNPNLYICLLSCSVISIHFNIDIHMCKKALVRYICLYVKVVFVMRTHGSMTMFWYLIVNPVAYAPYSPSLSIDLFMCAVLHQFLANIEDSATLYQFLCLCI